MMDGAPVGASAVFVGGDVAGIYSVATIPEARCRGIGAAVTMAAARHAAEHNCRVVTLQASAMGRPVYRRLGFKEYCTLGRYLRPAVSAGREWKVPLAMTRTIVDRTKFNGEVRLPYELRLADFEMAMQDVYDFFYDVNSHLAQKGLRRLDDMLRPAIMSGVVSDMLTASVAKHSRVLVENRYFNGHPDLLVQGVYPENAVRAGERGIEIKTTRKVGGAVDTHGARNQWMCVFVYDLDVKTEPAAERRPMTFTEVYLGLVTVDDFRLNPRSELGTRTATLHREGIKKLRDNWVYRI